MLFSAILQSDGVFRSVEVGVRDLGMRLRPAPPESAVALVLIGDADYRQLFDGRSPLDPPALAKLIEAVAAAKPRAVGIDIEASAPEYRELKIATKTVPVIWGRSAVFSNLRRRFLADEILGGRESAPSGLIVLKQDQDDAVRRYQRLYLTDRGLLPSLPWALVRASRQSAPRGSDEERYVDFTGASPRFKLRATDVLKLAREQGWRDDSVLRDKIVLVGGDYGVQDEHDTPAGWMLGAEILAQIVDTELLHAGGARVGHGWLLVALQLLCGVLLLLLFDYFPLRRALLIGLLCFPFLACLGSLLAFRTAWRWTSFAPSLLALIAHEVYIAAGDYRESLLKRATTDLAEAGSALAPARISAEVRREELPRAAVEEQPTV